MVFECHKCQYRTTVKCNWEKHLKTKKHQLIVKNLKASVKSVELHPKNVESSDLKSINYEPNKSKKIIQNSELMCKWCMRYLSRKDSLQRHLMTCKNRIIFEKSQKVLNEVDFKCKYCNLNCANQSNLNRHFKTCPVLKITLNVEKEKEIKERNDKCPQVSTSVPDFKCCYCQNIYANKRSLSKHINICLKKKQEFKLLNLERDNEINKQIVEKSDKCPQVSTSVHNFKCCYCHNLYANNRSLSKHMHSCSKRQQEINTLKIINQEKDKCIEIAKQTKIVNNIQNNKTINFLDQNFGSMIAMEQFLYNLEHHQKLTIDERKMLLTSFKEGDLETFYRSFNYVLKENCRRQLEEQGLKDMKLLPLYCSDGNYRSHKEKEIKGWKTKYDNKNINRMLDICNNQVFETYQELLLIAGKNLTKLYKEVKKDNHENNFDDIHNNSVLKQIIED